VFGTDTDLNGWQCTTSILSCVFVSRPRIFPIKGKMPLTSLLFPLLALAVVLWIANGMLPRTDANLPSDGRPHQLITPTDHLLSAKRNHTPLVPQKMCPPVPPQMGKMFKVDKGRHFTPCHPRHVFAVGRIPVNNSLIQRDLTPAEIGADHWDSLLGPGGRNRPKSCTSRHKVAIIIPLRDREQHLRQFLRHMHPFLNKQQLDYTIFVVEQTGI
jgi:N-terminal region of glycosyl transferase group 7